MGIIVRNEQKQEAIYLIDICGRRYSEEEAARLNPLVLAYVGDSVFDLFVRTSLIGCGKAGRLHLLSADRVCARAQAEVIKELLPTLSEEEKEIFMRGRNAKTATVPRNAEVADYHMATGFEALVGYLYITGNDDRLKEIMRSVTEREREGFDE